MPHNVPLFLLASFLLLITPGPAVLYIIARSLNQGARAGLVSAVGVGLGAVVQIFAAALGLSAIILSSPWRFSLLKYLGAAYLIYLGIREILKVPVQKQKNLAKEPLGQIFRQGIVVNIFNPKLALFFLAFLPQFVNQEAGQIPMQMLILGFSFIALGIITDSIYALFAGQIARLFRSQKNYGFLSRYGAASVYIILGIITALTRLGHTA
ncbi:MAG: LysE family translocator [Deinococcales bacterium]